MSTILKLLSSERACNSSPANYSSRIVRVVNKGTITYTLVQKTNPQLLHLTVNSATDVTKILLASGDTANLVPGMFLVNSDALAVVNTGTNSYSSLVGKVNNVINSTAFAANNGVGLILSPGTANVYAVSNIVTISILPNSELIIQKSGPDFMEANNNSDLLAVGIAYA